MSTTTNTPVVVHARISPTLNALVEREEAARDEAAAVPRAGDRR